MDAWLTEVEPFVRAFVADIDEAFGLLTVDEPTREALRGLLTDQT